MFTNFLKAVGLDIPASVIGTLGAAVEALGEVTDSEMIQAVGHFIRDNAEEISS